MVVKRFLLFLVLLFCLMGCDPTVDTSSPESVEASVREVSANMKTRDEQKRFTGAIFYASSITRAAALRSGKNQDHVLADLLHGKTGQEVIVFVESGKFEQVLKERAGL